MIKERLLSFLCDMEGPPTYAKHWGLLDAQVLRFPDQAAVPKNPNRVYGQGWDRKFALPQSPVGVEDAQSLIIFKYTKPGAIGLRAERMFLFIQPLPRPMEQGVQFYHKVAG